jgi:hypothetical protein
VSLLQFLAEQWNVVWPVLTSLSAFLAARWQLEHRVDTEAKARVAEQTALKILTLTHEERVELGKREREAIFKFYEFAADMCRDLIDVHQVGVADGNMDGFLSGVRQLGDKRRAVFESLDDVRAFVVRSPQLIDDAISLVQAWEEDYFKLHEVEVALVEGGEWSDGRESLREVQVPSPGVGDFQNAFIHGMNSYLADAYYGRWIDR